MYRRLHVERDGRCDICQKINHGRYGLSVDHNHKTGEIRGLLCRKCNMAIGLIGDSPDTLARAIAYLLKDPPQVIP